MAKRIRTNNRVEAEGRVAWLVENKPTTSANLFLVRRDDVDHYGELEVLDKAEIKIRDIPGILAQYPENEFVFGFITQNDEFHPNAQTATLWTITRIVKPVGFNWLYSRRIGVLQSPKECQRIYSEGGLEVYSFCISDN